MKTIKIILKVIVILILFMILVQLFRSIGSIALNHSHIDTSLEFGANIKASIEIFSFLTALFLSVKSFMNRKYLKWVSVGVLSVFLVLAVSVVTTKIMLQNSIETNSSLEKNHTQ